MACLMKAKFSEIDSHYAYRLRLIDRADRVGQMAGMKSKMAQAKHEKDHYKRVGFEPHLAVDD